MPEPAKQFFKSGFYCIQVLLGVNHFTSKGGWGGEAWVIHGERPFFSQPLYAYSPEIFFSLE